MYRPETAPVLARIPEISPEKHHRKPDGVLSSAGRVLGQAISFKLLAAITVILLIIAVMPKAGSNPGRSPDQSVAQRVPDRPANPAAKPAKAAPAQKAPAMAPPTIVPALAGPAQPPVIISEAKVADKPVAKVAAEQPRMSLWPSAAHPVPSQTQPPAGDWRTGANQPMALHPDYNRSSQ